MSNITLLVYWGGLKRVLSKPPLITIINIAMNCKMPCTCKQKYVRKQLWFWGKPSSKDPEGVGVVPYLILHAVILHSRPSP